MGRPQQPVAERALDHGSLDGRGVRLDGGRWDRSPVVVVRHMERRSQHQEEREQGGDRRAAGGSRCR
jgi:hypothetical protein